MKSINLIIVFLSIALFSCGDLIDQTPQSNLNSATFYTNEAEVRAGLNGCYNGLQSPMNLEWQFTEVRSDNAKQGVVASANSFNLDLNSLDMFFPISTNNGIYQYWLRTYNNIRNTNIILDRLGVNYDPTTGNINLGTINIPISDASRKQLAGEALFIRAYHYFNLVRLFGGTMIVTKPITAEEAKSINRSSVDDMYKLITADLKAASEFLPRKTRTQITGSDIGRVNIWAAKAMLGKAYLTLNRKAEAITQLQDVVTNSGYSLVTSAGSAANAYANLFSITNEMNSEILFAVRYKAGGLGLGSRFGNDFAALLSGSTIINGSGQGWNFPSLDLDSVHMLTTTPAVTFDQRRATNIAIYVSGSSMTPYVRKYVSPVVLTNDGESDWPILRYADVLLLLAEAQGFTPASIALINQVRKRAGLADLPATVNSIALFEKALAVERRIEFAFENQRWFDLLRFNTTMSTITAEQTMKDHFAREFLRFYATYPAPALTLAQLQANVTKDRLLLPIPQYEIDTNTKIVIPQNPGY
jgi:hypothetical protein